jgi:hypothetical protein
MLLNHAWTVSQHVAKHCAALTALAVHRAQTWRSAAQEAERERVLDGAVGAALWGAQRTISAPRVAEAARRLFELRAGGRTLRAMAGVARDTALERRVVRLPSRSSAIAC